MGEFSDAQFLHDAEVDLLRRLLGRTLNGVTSSPLSVLYPYFFADCFLWRLGEEGYFTIRNDWTETPDGFDYGRLRFDVTEEPEGFRMARSEHGPYLEGTNRIQTHPYMDVAPVRYIDVYAEHYRKHDEDVRFDAAIVFRREDHSAFRFGPERSSIGRVEFCSMWRDVWDIEVRLERRLRLE